MRFVLPLALGCALAGCGDNNPTKPDAARPPDAPPPDAFDPLSFADNEGGEIRLEWIEQVNAGVAQTTARGTAYFYKSQTPAKFPIPAFPGCFDMRAKDKWPLAQGTIEPLDVGGVTIKSKSGTPLVFTKDGVGAACDAVTPCATGYKCINAMCRPLDPFSRPHDLWYKKAAAFANNDGDTFFPPNQTYDVEFAGSADWPAQTIKDIAFMPARWEGLDPPITGTVMLQQDTPLTLSYTPVTSSNLPPGYHVNTVVAFTGTPNTGPLVLCQEEGTDGSITVPADLVNLLRMNGPGRFVRQQLTHALFELTDGAPKPPGVRKRVDVLTIYCYNTAWAAAP